MPDPWESWTPEQYEAAKSALGKLDEGHPLAQQVALYEQSEAAPGGLPDELDIPEIAEPPLDQPGGIWPELGRKVISPLVAGTMRYGDVLSGGAFSRLAEAGEEAYESVAPEWATTSDKFSERQTARETAHPYATGAATVLGYATPARRVLSVPGLLSNAVGAGVRRLPGMAARMSPAALQAARPLAGMGQRLATSVPVGAATDVAVTAAEKGVAAAAGEETGDWADDLTRAVMTGALGGLAGELISSAGQAAFHGLRETPKFMPYISHLEEGGGGPHPLAPNLAGVGKPTGFDDMMRKARRDKAASATEQAATEAAPYVGHQIGKTDAAVRARQEAFNESYYTSEAGRTGQPTDEILDALVSSMNKRGESFFKNKGKLGELGEFIENATEVVAVPRGGTKPSGNTVHKLPGGERQARQLLGDNPVQDALARSGGTGTALARQGTALARQGTGLGRPRIEEETWAHARNVEDGAALGSPRVEQETWARVNDPVSGAVPGGPPGGPMSAPPGTPMGAPPPVSDPKFDFYLVPKKVDAKTLDTITNDLETLVKREFPDAERFRQAAFRVRDKFPGNDIAPNPAEPEVLADGTVIDQGWSYAKRKMTRELGELEATKKSAGLRTDESVVDVPLPKGPEAEQVLTEQVRRIAKGIQNYGAEGTGPSVRFVERLLKDNPQGADAFRRFMATKGYEKVMDAMGTRINIGGNLGTGRTYSYMTRFGDVLKMRMDPLARQAMSVTPEAGGRLGVPLENLQLLESLLGKKEE